MVTGDSLSGPTRSARCWPRWRDCSTCRARSCWATTTTTRPGRRTRCATSSQRQRKLGAQAAVAGPGRGARHRGWVDLTHRHATVRPAAAIALAGINDPTPRRDRYEQIAGPADPAAVVRIGVDPRPRAAGARPLRRRRLRPGAGRPHPRRAGPRARHRRAGHQLRHRPVPGPRAVPLGIAHLAATCPRASAPAPYLPMRFCCRPEATLITLRPRGSRRTPCARARSGGPGTDASARLVQASGCGAAW